MSDDQQPKEIGKIWGFIKELKATVFGHKREIEIILVGQTGNNGLTGDIKKIIQRQDGMEDTMNNMIATHIGTCPVAEQIKEKEKKQIDGRRFADKAALELQKARIAMIGAVTGSVIVAICGIIVALISRRPVSP
jgi:hypothetical protein